MGRKMLANLKKTITAMQCCLNRNYFSKCPAACPYNGTEQDGACGQIVLRDALKLLKEAAGYKCEIEMGMRPAVVRCGECAYWTANNAEEGDCSGVCHNGNSPAGTTDMTWFCPEGERMDD